MEIHFYHLLNDKNEYENEVYNIENIECVNQKTLCKILLNSKKIDIEMIKFLCDLNFFAEKNQYQKEYEEKIKEME